MIDVEAVDQWFEAGYESGNPITFCLFDRRVIMPSAQMAGVVAERSGEATSAGDIQRFANAGWLRLEPCSECAGEVGATPYVVERIVLFKALQREGWGNAELGDYAEFEDAMVESFADEDDGFPYIDDDIARLIQYHKARIEAISCGETCDEDGNLVDRNDELTNVRKELAFLERLKAAGVPPDLEKAMAKCAFRARAFDEAACVMIVEGWRSQLRAGFTINVEFDRSGWNAEDGDRAFFHGEINWRSTVRSAYGANEGEATDPIIRVPGFVLCGERVTPSKTVRPHEYERLWKESDIEAYIAAWSEIRGRPTCMNCYARLPEPNAKNARFCSQKCREAAKARRYRERNPDSAARAREKYRASIAEDE